MQSKVYKINRLYWWINKALSVEGLKKEHSFAAKVFKKDRFIQRGIAKLYNQMYKGIYLKIPKLVIKYNLFKKV